MRTAENASGEGTEAEAKELRVLMAALAAAHVTTLRQLDQVEWNLDATLAYLASDRPER